MQTDKKRVSQHALDLEKLIANRFNRLLWRISNYGNRQTLVEQNISLSEWRMMAQLATIGRMPVGKLSQLSGVGQTVGSRTIKSLKLKGYVETRKSTIDSRQLLVQLSDYGFSVHDIIAPQRNTSHQQVQAGLTQDELATLFNLCDKLELHLDQLTTSQDDGW